VATQERPAATDDARKPELRSFWIAGYDGADHLPGSGMAFDLIDATGHARRIDEDYRAARDVGIACVRETIGWRRARRPYGYDFEGLLLRAHSARRHGIQVLWTLSNSDWPDDVDVLAPDFVDRFRDFAAAAAHAVREAGDDYAPIYTPFDEISFLSWGLSETALFSPHRRDMRNRGHEVKQQLVRAVLAACDAIVEIDARARFLHTDAMVRAAAAPNPDGPAAASVERLQFEAWDMLSGRLEPNLGGHPRYLDIVGVNCYASRQTESSTLRPLPGQRGGRRRVPLHHLLSDVYIRYRRPIVVGEKSPMGVSRAQWLREIGDEIREALQQGVPLLGACLHPAADRADWKNPRRWRSRGLWDVVLHPQADPGPYAAYAQMLRVVEARVNPATTPSTHRDPS
jgi:UDP-galactopyranose mutase